MTINNVVMAVKSHSITNTSNKRNIKLIDIIYVFTSVPLDCLHKWLMPSDLHGQLPYEPINSYGLQLKLFISLMGKKWYFFKLIYVSKKVNQLTSNYKLNNFKYYIYFFINSFLYL